MSQLEMNATTSEVNAGARHRKRPNWSRDDAVSASCTIAQSSSAIKHQRLSFGRLLDANASCRSSSPLHSTKFDSTGRVLLTAGLDGHVRILGKDTNSDTYHMQHSLRIEGSPIQKANFVGEDSRKILVAGSDGLCVTDIETSVVEKIPLGGGDWQPATFTIGTNNTRSPLVCLLGGQGGVCLLSLASRSKIATFKASGKMKGAVFRSDGRELITVNHEGTVHVWCFSAFT